MVKVLVVIADGQVTAHTTDDVEVIVLNESDSTDEMDTDELFEHYMNEVQDNAVWTKAEPITYAQFTKIK